MPLKYTARMYLIFNVNDWTEIDLDVPVTIDASEELWFGLYVDMPEAGAVMGADSGPAIDGYGNMYHLYGSWHHDFNLNWNIQAKIEEPALPVYLHWDNGMNYTTVLVTFCSHFKWISPQNGTLIILHLMMVGR